MFDRTATCFFFVAIVVAIAVIFDLSRSTQLNSFLIYRGGEMEMDRFCCCRRRRRSLVVAVVVSDIDGDGRRSVT